MHPRLHPRKSGFLSGYANIYSTVHSSRENTMVSLKKPLFSQRIVTESSESSQWTGLLHKQQGRVITWDVGPRAPEIPQSGGC